MYVILAYDNGNVFVAADFLTCDLRCVISITDAIPLAYRFIVKVEGFRFSLQRSDMSIER